MHILQLNFVLGEEGAKVVSFIYLTITMIITSRSMPNLNELSKGGRKMLSLFIPHGGTSSKCSHMSTTTWVIERKLATMVVEVLLTWHIGINE